MIAAVLSFFIITGLLGHGLIALVTGRRRVTAEIGVLAPGAGLALFVCLSVLFNTVGVPLVWWAFLAAGLLFEGLGQLRAHLAPAADDAPLVSLGDIPLGVAVVLGAALLAVMLHGEFLAPWLNDDDSWEHASTAKYIAVHHTYSISPEVRPQITSYLEPYPPGFPVLIAVMHQHNHSLSTTLRVFNILIAALAIPWFYLAAKEYTGRASAALWMTGMLAILPCFMSHFIWAQTLAVTLFFPAFYALERCRREPMWAVIAAIAVAAVALTQPSSAEVFGLMAALAWLAHLVSALFRKGEPGPATAEHRSSGTKPGRWNAVVFQGAAAAGALLIAAAFFAPEYVKFGHNEFYHGIGKIPAPPPPAKGEPPAPNVKVNLTQMSGTGFGVTYSLRDVAFAPAIYNKINQPIGIGCVLFAVAVAGVVLSVVMLRRLAQEPLWLIMLLWLGLGLVGIEGNRVGVSLFPHRYWVFFSIPVAMLAGSFLAWLGARLTRPVEALAAGAGAGLGGLLVFSTLAEKLDCSMEGLPSGVAEMGLTGAVAALLVVSIFLAAATVGVAVYLIAMPRPAGRPPKDLVPPAATPSLAVPALCFAGLFLLVGGIGMTSAYAKVRLQGFCQFPAGVRFYSVMATTEDGRRVPVREDAPEMKGYLALQGILDPDTPVLVLNGPDDHAVGFDMWALPYDNDILALRRRADVIDPWDRPLKPVVNAAYLDDALALAKKKGFRYVMVDLWRAADRQQAATMARRSVGDCGQLHNVSMERLTELLVHHATPTVEEEKFIGDLRGGYETMLILEGQEKEAFDVAEQLRALMHASKLLEPRPVLDSGAFGVTVYAVK